jgi:Sec-independent protein translocase protein TatA
MADTDVCVGLIVLLIIVIIVFIIAKIIGWGSKVAANIGQYRQGTAVKRIAQEGLTLDQRQPAQPAQPATSPAGPVCVSCKKPFEGGEFCNWCGTKQREKCFSCGTDNPANAPYCRKCGKPMQRERKS